MHKNSLYKDSAAKVCLQKGTIRAKKNLIIANLSGSKIIESTIRSEKTSGRFQIVADTTEGDIRSEEIINTFEFVLLDLFEK